jgi:hypothetical protein
MIDTAPRYKPFVVHTFRTKCSTMSQPPGFGDFLRGSLALAILCEEKSFDLKLDFSNHPMNSFLQNPHPQLESSTDGVVEEFFCCSPLLLKDYLNLSNISKNPLIITNVYPKTEKINTSIKLKIQSYLKFNSIIEDIVEDIQKKFSSNSYAVLHIRTTDKDFYKDNIADKEVKTMKLISKYIKNKLIPKYKENIILISNNKYIKEFISSSFNIYHIKNEPIHLGHLLDLEANQINTMVKDTIVDFVIMSRASAIYSYCTIGGMGRVSGFSKYCADIYDVRFINIKEDIDIKHKLKKTMRNIIDSFNEFRK